MNRRREFLCTSACRHHNQGFTLIEVLVVVALIAIIAAIGIPSLSSSFQVSLSAATRQLGSVVKEAYQATLITGKLHRVAYDLKSNEYWVEIGSNMELLETDASRERAERRKHLRFGEKEKPNSNFSIDKSVTSKKKSLPQGVKFDDIITQQNPDPQTAETVATTYTHIFPNGMTEQTLIHLSDSSQHHTTLSIAPILGKTDVYEGNVRAEEIFGK